jgi:hypothetical protein
MNGEPEMKVCCIEAEYDRDPLERSSVRPLLDVLEAQKLARYVLRDAVTQDELLHLVTRWASEPRYRAFRYLYFAGHGLDGTLTFDENCSTSLPHLAAAIAGSKMPTNRVVHFGACSVLTDDAKAEKFMHSCGVSAVYGYATDVDWIDSAALDLLLMARTAECFNSGRLSRRLLYEALSTLLQEQAGLAAKLGLRVWIRQRGEPIRLRPPITSQAGRNVSSKGPRD